MGTLVEQLIAYLESATPEQLEEDWKELEPYNEIGPSAEEWMKYAEERLKELKQNP